LDIYTTTIRISILIYIAIGSYAGRGVKRLDDCYVALRIWAAKVFKRDYSPAA